MAVRKSGWMAVFLIRAVSIVAARLRAGVKEWRAGSDKLSWRKCQKSLTGMKETLSQKRQKSCDEWPPALIVSRNYFFLYAQSTHGPRSPVSYLTFTPPLLAGLSLATRCEVQSAVNQQSAQHGCDDRWVAIGCTRTPRTLSVCLWRETVGSCTYTHTVIVQVLHYSTYSN
jgi:hypothetical protein